MFSDYPRLLGRFRTTHRRFYRSKCPLISYQLSVISYQLSVISYQLSVISYQLSVISYQLSVISYQFTVYCLLITEKLPTYPLPYFQFIIHNLYLLMAFKQ
jgi:hypothetical protein